MKLSFEICLIIIVLVFSIAFFTCFRYWADTEVMTNYLCKHSKITTAALVRKTPIGACGWLIKGEKRMEEHWFNCEQYEIGDIIDWKYTNYDCDDLVKTSLSSP